MPNRPLPPKFSVAFSFAGEERGFTRQVIEAVERRLGVGTVFFDEWFEPYIAGPDADLRLQKIYGQDSELVVACISERYGGKAWTRMEHAAIRARVMQLRESGDSRDILRILMLRVGAGDVPGVLSNDIVPDVRDRTPEAVADLVVARLELVRGGSPKAPGVVVEPPNWPTDPIPFDHGLADRAVREWPAVLRLLTRGSKKRILRFQAPSGFSKSALLRATARYAKQLRVPTAFVDFKDTALRSELSVLKEIQAGLGRALPDFFAQAVPDRWKLQASFETLKTPTLILLDTYEKILTTKELTEWIETKLLAAVEDCEPLRFVIAGKDLPPLTDSAWRRYAEDIELGAIKDLAIWIDWVHQLNPNVEAKHVEGIVLGLEGVPGSVSTALEACARNLANRP